MIKKTTWEKGGLFATLEDSPILPGTVQNFDVGCCFGHREIAQLRVVSCFPCYFRGGDRFPFSTATKADWEKGNAMRAWSITSKITALHLDAYGHELAQARADVQPCLHFGDGCDHWTSEYALCCGEDHEGQGCSYNRYQHK